MAGRMQGAEEEYRRRTETQVTGENRFVMSDDRVGFSRAVGERLDVGGEKGPEAPLGEFWQGTRITLCSPRQFNSATN